MYPDWHQNSVPLEFEKDSATESIPAKHNGTTRLSARFPFLPTDLPAWCLLPAVNRPGFELTPEVGRTSRNFMKKCQTEFKLEIVRKDCAPAPAVPRRGTRSGLQGGQPGLHRRLRRRRRLSPERAAS